MIISPARFVALFLCVTVPLRADIVVNEVMSAGAERTLRWSPSGVPSFGFGTPWNATAFDDSAWQSGAGPFGFGTFTNASPTPTIGTNTATQMQNLTPTLYLRKTFTASATDAARADALLLDVQFNDGFVCYVNGVEVGRRNAGPTNGFVYHDQFAAFGTPSDNEDSTTPYLRTLTISLGAANTRLVAGTNVIAIHSLNHWESTFAYNTAGDGAFVTVDNRSNLYIKADLRMGGAAPVTLAANNSTWRYFPGVAEPSGGVYDRALLSSGKLRVPWGNAAFDDTTWATGAAPFGAGTPPAGVTLGTNVTSQVVGITPSVYFRIVFNASAADVADPLALQLLNDWDDGFVAYLNGVEVARTNMSEANAFTPHNAVATTARAGGTSTTFTLDPAAKLLNVGQNVLAVQVHNLAINDADLFFRTRLQRTGGAKIYVNYTDSWKYFVGVGEPIQETDEATEDNAEAPESQLDWVELNNTGAVSVSLADWTLSDDPAEPRKWTFPAGTNLAAGAHLLIICDGLDITAPANGGYLHSNFSLSRDGETIGIYDPTGALVHQVNVPKGRPFQSFGRDGSGQYVYLDPPTPLAANSAAVPYVSTVAAPAFSVAAGFHTGTQAVTLTTATPGATIRYTIDGSEPTETTGIAYTSAAAVTSSRALRARAFLPGMLPSDVVTRTYLISEPNSRKGIPALCITADQGRSLYRPHGIMAIVGGAYTDLTAPAPVNRDTIWSQAGPGAPAVPDLSAYNNPIHRGRFLERPATMEVLYANGTPGVNVEFGARISGSGHARPRYKLTNQNSATPNNGAWSATDFTQKPSFNFYFRNELGGDPLAFPLFPDDPIGEFHDLRCRAGKNDPSNPFVEDEFMRRLFVDTGAVGSVGIINTLYVNGIYKGYYNLCQHLREDFFQRHHGSDLAWDVRQVAVIASGDGLAFQEMITFLRNNPQTTLANYQGMKTRLDMVNFIDYLIVNLFGVTGDWPHNNYVCARERSANGLHRYYLWDAEGAFGDFNGNVRTNQFVAGTTGSVITTAPTTVNLGEGIRILYTLLRASPEFKLLFADRLQKHFFDTGGALTAPAALARWASVKAEIQPFVGTVTDRVTPWLNGVGDPTRYTTSGTTNTPSRYNVLFNGYTDDTAGGAFVPSHLVAEGLWPAILAPTFSLPAGTIAPGSTLTISNPSGSGTIFYTTDGRDPRAEGGAIAGTTYSAPIAINFPTTVRARVRSTGGVWSPLREAFFDTGAVPSLLITEIMYHPPINGAIDGDEYEFVEIKNVGAQTVNLFGMKFTAGITYTFPPGATVAAGAHVVIAKNASRFAEKYPAAPLLDAWGAGSGLANGGEKLTLADAAGRTVFSVTYDNSPPWPVQPDGNGQSLVPVNPNALPVPNNANNWRASTVIGGSPGADDPAPPVLPIYVNELLANAGTDRVELHNPNATAVNVSDWWLSDDIATPKKYRIPAATSIAAGGFLVLEESQFNSGVNAFSFSSYGDEVVLSSGDATGALTGYSHVFEFGASEFETSFGRHLNSQSTAYFVPQRAQTFGAVNAGPKIGPLVITELMAEPAAGGDEYLELRNISTAPLALFDPANPANTWKVNGIGFTFPQGVTLQPRQVVILSPIAPAAFASKYNVPGAITVFGPYTGALNNAGERITLQKPGAPYLNAQAQTVVPLIAIDSVDYDDVQPWPTAAANGRSIERIDALAFADDPANWQASAVAGTIGIPTAQNVSAFLASYFTGAELADPAIGGLSADPDGDGLSNFREWAHGLNPRSSDAQNAWTWGIETHGATPYLTMHYRRSLSATGASFLGDTTASPTSWSLDAALQIGTPVNNGDGSETVTERDTFPAQDPGAPQRLIRLRITAP